MMGESSAGRRRKLAAILHADIADSTALVQRDETIAHEAFQQCFRLLSDIIGDYGGATLEVRGDALVGEFARGSDAIAAALCFQQLNTEPDRYSNSDFRPEARIGISLGEVIVADDTVTGPGVVLAQRLEQLASPGGLVVQGALAETVPDRLPFIFQNLGEQTIKGFDRTVRAFTVSITSGDQIPGPDESTVKETPKGEGSGATEPVPGVPISVAVLPFDNMSGDPEQEYFSDGITEDIITELSRFRSLSVIARNSSFSFRGRHLNVGEIAEELGVAYLVEGSVRRSGDRLRITAQLVETDSGSHVWAQRYDRKLKDIFEVQDEVSQMIVSTLGGRLEDHRIRIADRSGENAWNAYDLVLQAQSNHYRILKSANARARELLEQAFGIDPDNARCHSLMGAVDLLDYSAGWTANLKESLDRALDHGRRSIQLDNSDSLAHARLGETLIHIGEMDRARSHFQKALELNPNDSESRALYSIFLVAAGEVERALNELETVRKIDPFERIWYPWLRGTALFYDEQYEQALTSFEEVTEPINGMRAMMAGCYAMTGDREKATQHLQAFLEVARQELADFPGPRLEDWKRHWQLNSDTLNEKNLRQLEESLRIIWA